MNIPTIDYQTTFVTSRICLEKRPGEILITVYSYPISAIDNLIEKLQELKAQVQKPVEVFEPDESTEAINPVGKETDWTKNWTKNAMPTHAFELALNQIVLSYVSDDTSYQWCAEKVAQHGSDEQWQMVLNTLEYLDHPDDFEAYLS